MAKKKRKKDADQSSATKTMHPIQNETATEATAPAGDPTPAPAQGNEGQAVAAEGADPSARHDPELTEQSDVGGTLTVTGPAKGRWRAGHRFTPEATVLPLSELTDDQVIAITNDPELLVQHSPAAD